MAKPRPALVGLDQHHQLAEDPAEVAAVDLVDDEDVGAVRVGGGPPAEVVEDPVPALEPALSSAASPGRSPRRRRTGGTAPSATRAGSSAPISAYASRRARNVLPTPGGTATYCAISALRRHSLSVAPAVRPVAHREEPAAHTIRGGVHRVRLPDGSFTLLPRWMTSPSAARSSPSSRPLSCHFQRFWRSSDSSPRCAGTLGMRACRYETSNPRQEEARHAD